jgi:hypothetical protein
MPFKLTFHGGVEKPSHNVTEKFLAFCLVERQEIPIYEMQKNGLVFADPEAYADSVPTWIRNWLISEDNAAPTDAQRRSLEIIAKHRLISSHPYFKIFCFKHGFGIPKQRKTFVVKLMESGGHEIAIRPFSRLSEFIFSAPHALLLTNGEVESVLKPGLSISLYKEEQREATSPALLEQMLKIKKRPMEAISGVRRLKV